MKVLLVEDVNKLGWLGDVVEVNDGYARNFLLPQGLAQPVTEANIKAIADEKEKRAKERLAESERAQQLCEAVNGAEAVIAAKANPQGHLFGSVTEKDIARNLNEQGFLVSDEVIRLKGHIKETGTHQVELKFPDAGPDRLGPTATINVVVVAEGEEVQPAAQAEGQAQPQKSDRPSADREDISEAADADASE